VAKLAPVDLHTHSTASDGTSSPADVVRLAHASGLSGLALTDHDTVAGIAEASAEAEQLGLDFLPGIELSCSVPRPGTLHVLGYGIDPRSPVLRKLIDEQSAGREERNRLILDRLNGLGLDLHWDEVVEAAGGPDRVGSIGRPHLASLLVRKGHVASSRQAFDRYLGGAGAAYVDTNRLSAERAFATIRAAGGLASAAHPLQLRRQTWAQLEALIRELSEQGLEAIETIHSGHDEETVARLTRLADRLDLLTTGGSDFHGSSKPGIRIGRPAGREVPREFFDRVVARTRERKQRRSRPKQSLLCSP